MINTKVEKTIELLNNKLNHLQVDFKIDKNIFIILALDITRVADKKYTVAINNIKNNLNININSVQKENIRKYFIGYPININLRYNVDQYKPDISQEYINNACELLCLGILQNETVMINSIIARIKKNFINSSFSAENEYLNYIRELQINKNQLTILEVNADQKYSSNQIANIIKDEYDSLSNYHYMIIIFSDGKESVSWKTISEVSLFMEQFKTEYNFNIFNKKYKDKKEKELNAFIDSNHNIKQNKSITNVINKFYEGVSYGFQFEDLFITKDGNKKILVMQKVELDDTPKKCPSCLEEQVRSNSYPKILYKGFECQNSMCPSRSKIGRGKRYDLFGAKRQIMLERNSAYDLIPDDIYKAFRKDIIDGSNVSIENIILLYSWAGDNIKIINPQVENENINNFKYRSITCEAATNLKNEDLISQLDIYKLFNTIKDYIILPNNCHPEKEIKIGDSVIYNGNSTNCILAVSDYSKINKFAGAITSPPYYNAREYSQWSNMICYLIDMMINAKAVMQSLREDSTYIYNVGDIVGQDNIYVDSSMSKRRQMLGFYSIFIFELLGYKTIGNIIWDKGEVQSKRNATPNRLSGYIKPINVYEHCLIFSNNKNKSLLHTEIKRIETVKKINSKGENNLGHTAPYPEDIAKLIIPFVKTNDWIADPFLGSGTTLIAFLGSDIRVAGFELNNKYFQLSAERSSNYYKRNVSKEKLIKI